MAAPLLASLGLAVATPAITGGTEGLAGRITDSFKDWQGTSNDKAKIEEAVTSFRVLGGNEALRRNPASLYAQSPLMQHIKSFCYTPGVIYVAYVPHNKGKTTACFACMDKPYVRRGIAFSPEIDNTKPYFDSIVDLLGFDPDNSPTGFMKLLRQSLEKEDEGDRKDIERNLIILDNFMPSGFNKVDVAFIHNLKAQVRETGVTVLVLTSHKEAASTLLSENSLGTIVPLMDAELIQKFKNEYGEIVKGVPLDFDWEELLPMKWDKDELKKAMEHSFAFKRLDGGKQERILKRFDNVFSGLPEVVRNEATPVSIIREFSEANVALSMPTNAGDNRGTQQRGCSCLNGCVIL